jgi:threonine dehydrogenase-like Zn-dependent dehydrogenase
MVILGGGPMGLLLLQIAKLRGASPVILSEVVDYRREKAKELGADIVVNPKEDDLYKVVKEVTDGRGADVAIEAIGNLTTYKQAFTVVRKGGCIVAFGAAPADGTIDVSPFEIYSRELTIRASYAGTYHTWPEAISLLLWDMVRLDPLITHKLPLESIHKGYEMIKEKKHKALKILVSPEL